MGALFLSRTTVLPAWMNPELLSYRSYLETGIISQQTTLFNIFATNLIMILT